MRRDARGNWVERRSYGRNPVTGRQVRRSHTVSGELPEDEARAEMDAWFEVHGAIPGEYGAAPSVADMLAVYIDGLEGVRSPATLAGYREDLKLRIAPTVGRIDVADLRPHHVQRAVSEMLAHGRADGGPLEAATVRRALAALSGAYDQWVDDGIVDANPVRQVVWPRPGRPDVRGFSDAELAAVKALIAADVEGGDPDRPYGAVFMTMMLTGMRLGEALGLTWADWWPSEPALEVSGTVVERPRLHRQPWPKTRRSRKVAVAGELAGAIASRGPGAASAPIFPFRGGWGRPSTASRWFSRELAAAGIKGHSHMLRHTMATRLVAAGCDLKTVQGRLGHASARTTMDLYADFLPASDREAAEGYAASLGRIAPGTGEAGAAGPDKENGDKAWASRRR